MARLDYDDITVGSDSEVLEYQVTDGGVPIPLGGSTVTWKWVNRDTGATVVDDAAGTIVDAAEGVVGYPVAPADVAVAQPIIAQVTIVYPSTEQHRSKDINFAIVRAI